MGLWNSICRFFGFRAQSPEPFDAGKLSFRSLDVDAIKNHLRLATKARRRAENGEPSTNSMHLDEVESEIVGVIQSEYKRAADLVGQQSRAFVARLGPLDLEQIVSEIKMRAEKAYADFDAHVAMAKVKLVNCEDALREARTNLSNFQQQHNLHSSPSQRGGVWTFISIAVMVILFCIETYFNGVMLGMGTMGGIVAGIGMALVFSLINLVAGVLVGLTALHDKNSIETPTALWGWFFILLWILLIGGFNLFVGHYRDALGSEQWEQASILAKQTMFSDPFDLDTFQSYVLWALGCFVSFAVALDTYWLDDPYPGYGRKYRDFTSARDELSEQKRIVQRDMERRRDRAIKDIEARRVQATRWKADFAEVMQGIAMVENAFRRHIKHLEDAGNALLRTYREENARSRRPGDAVPNHFSEPWVFTPADQPELPRPKIWDESEIRLLVSQATAALDEHVKKIHQGYSAIIVRLQESQG